MCFNYECDYYFPDVNRRISRPRIGEGAFPPAVLGVHVGKWNLSASPPADAQHRGAAGVSGPHSEDGGDQVRPFDYMGGLCNLFTKLLSSIKEKSSLTAVIHSALCTPQLDVW